MTSYKVEVRARGESKYTGAALRFATRKEADAYAVDLAFRWTLVVDWHTVESSDPVNHAMVDGKLMLLTPSEVTPLPPGIKP